MNLGLIAHIGKQAISAGAKVSGVVVKHSPEILLGIGLVGGAATTIGAVKATLECEKVLEEAQNGYEKINEALDVIDRETYTTDMANKDIAQVHAVCVGGIIKNVAPVVILGGISITSILCGYNIINRRYASVVAAYAALDSGFKAYRRRVVTELGEDADYKFRTGSVSKKIDREIVDPETGEVKKKKVKEEILESESEPIDYQINFCREAIHIPDCKDITHSLDFIISVENSVNCTLKAMKYVTLNEVRRCLGVPEVSYGQIVGWTLDGTGDDFITLNPRIIFDEELGQDTIILDPNVDGIMFNKISKLNDRYLIAKE